MKKYVLQITLAVATLLIAPPACPAQVKPTTVPERIGTYDSRAIAVAFVGSPIHVKQLNQLKEQHDAAKAAGDTGAKARLEEQAKAQQTRLHQQAFGTADVADILEHLGDAMPGIEKEAGVTIFVSKWNAAELQNHEGGERVDVTMPLVDALKPTERQRRSAIEIQKHK